jgi:hypothetical protein
MCRNMNNTITKRDTFIHTKSILKTTLCTYKYKTTFEGYMSKY